MVRKVLVVGSSSGCGLEVTKLLSTSEDFQVHALVRDQERARNALGNSGDKVSFVVGDVTKKETLAPACKDMDAVVCTIGARAGWRFPNTQVKDTPKFVDYLGVKDLGEASAAAKVPKFVLLSSMSVTRPFSPVAILLNTLRGRVLSWKFKGEESIRQAYSANKDLGYYIIRPGGLTNNEGGQHKIIAEQGDKGLGSIARKDVALVVRACLLELCPHRNVTFEIMSDKSSPAVDLKDVLAKLTPD